MEKLIILNILLFLCIIILASLLIYTSKSGFLGLTLKIFCKTDNKTDYFVLLIIFFSLIMAVVHLLLAFMNYFINDLPVDFLFSNVSDQDPVRWWPSGTPQTWGIMGAAAAVYKTFPGSNRAKITAALATFGVTIPTVVLFHAVENPNGFNRLMYSMVEYKKTGSWPATLPDQISDATLLTNPNMKKAIEDAVKKIQETSSSNPSSSSSFLPSDNLFDSFLKYILDIFRPVPVEGYLDDLLGQQLFIYILLLIIVISLIIFLILFTFINIMLHNKEFILKRFNNKYILFYLKYQQVLAKISLFVLPIIMMLGLIELFVGLHFLITHPIPFEELPIDLHTFFKKPS